MAKSKASTSQASNGQAQKPQRKKNDPLKPQPAWLFPNDEDNPVLNPAKKSAEEEQKDIDDRLAAIKYLEHKSVTAPVKKPPPGTLMQLVGAFLTSYGFDHTGRIFTIERNARKKINGWEDAIGEKFEKGTPSLVQIYKRWQREWELEKAELKATGSDDTSSEESDEEDEEEEKEAKKPAAKTKKVAADSDSSSDSDSDSEAEEKAAPMKATMTVTKAQKRKSSSSDSESDSGSDSSSSDESDAPSKKRKVEVNGKGAKKVSTTEKANGVKTKEVLKTTPVKTEETTIVKAVADSSDSSETDSDSDSDSDSSSDSSDDEGVKTKGTTQITNGTKASSAISNVSTASTDSTSTLSGEPTKKDASSSSESDSSSDSSDSSEDEAPATKASVKAPAPQKRKRSKSPAAATTPVSAVKVAKKSNEPFSRIPKDQYVDPRLESNKYVPYDYAQRAHEDLIVTKGKGFTKEKNKKKRGSYRGGAIDVGGGKGIKFDD